MTSMAYSTISLLTNNPIMIKENANYYKSLNDDISDSYNTITMKKWIMGWHCQLLKSFYGLLRRLVRWKPVNSPWSPQLVVSFKLFHGLKQGLY